jgi:hypothetical protein
VFPNGNGLTDGEDSVLIYKPTVVGANTLDLETNALYLGNGEWGDVSDPYAISLNNYVVRPCQGFILYTAAARANVTIGGGEVSYVKNGPTQISVYQGYTNFVGGMNPLVPNIPSETPAAVDASTLAQSGLLSLAAGDDALVLPSIDGNMIDLSNLIHDGSVITDLYAADPNASQNAKLVANGRAFFVLPSVDDRIIIPQSHP